MAAAEAEAQQPMEMAEEDEQMGGPTLVDQLQVCVRRVRALRSRARFQSRSRAVIKPRVAFRGQGGTAWTTPTVPPRVRRRRRGFHGAQAAFSHHGCRRCLTGLRLLSGHGWKSPSC